MRVFVPQEPIKFVGGVPEPLFDLTPASKYGELIFLLPSGKVMLNTMPMVNTLNQKLKDFNDDDFILAIGDPSAIATVSAIASFLNRGRFKMLKWDKGIFDYIVVKVDISGKNYDENKL